MEGFGDGHDYIPTETFEVRMESEFRLEHRVESEDKGELERNLG